jgi:hypothetical protein
MRLIVACLAAVCVAVVVSIPLAFAMGSLGPAVAGIALEFGLFVGIVAFLSVTRPAPACKLERAGVFGWVTIVVGALFSLRAFCWLVFTDHDKVMVLSPNNLGDLALHLTYINNLANGAPFWPDNPIFAGAKLHYPIGVDLFNGLLVLCHADIYRSLIWVGLIGCFLTGVALYRWGGAFTLAGFLFNGGVAGFKFLQTQEFHDYQAELAWKSLSLAMFVTQRGLLFALPAGLVLLCSWRTRFFSNAEPADDFKLPLWIEILFYSSMPLFHLHTFIFLSMLLAYWFIASPHRLRAELLKLVLASLIPATIAVSLTTGMFQPHHGPAAAIVRGPGLIGAFDYLFSRLGLPFHIMPGWMQEKSGPLAFLDFWFTNFGLLPVFVVALIILLALSYHSDERSRNAAAFVFPAVGIFVLACFVMFAPWEWDNTKIMIWCYLAVLPYLWRNLIAAGTVWLPPVACLVLFFSGFVSLIGGIDGSHTGYDFTTRSELNSVAKAVKNIDISETFAAWPTYNHPLLLVGRKAVMGYNGHLWSHGIDYRQQEAQLTSLMMGEPGWREVAGELHARYLFWGTREEEGYQQSAKPWTASCRLVARGAWGAIYDLQRPPANE